MKDIYAYNEIIKKARSFFQDIKGFVEIPAQARQSILAACEDPTTISEYTFNGIKFPLPQTGQMWLEEELLDNLKVNGVFCITTSYRDEKNVIEGRHDKIFPMFEFESKGNIEDLKKLEKEFLLFLGFSEGTILNYEEACKKYRVQSLEVEHEGEIAKDYGNVVFLQMFPQRTHPFWNMKHFGNGIFSKVDVLIHGMETFGSAERSSNVKEMRDNFHKISGGKYAGLLFSKFGKERVLEELDRYLGHEMFPRFGGGIGVTRLARAMYLEGLMKKREVG